MPLLCSRRWWMQQSNHICVNLLSSSLTALWFIANPLRIIYSILIAHFNYSRRANSSLNYPNVVSLNVKLGHVVSEASVQPVHEKVLVVQQWPRPTSLRDLRGFLGLRRFYQHFIKGYATIAFLTLKDAVSTAPVLGLPNFSLPFTLETDALGSGMAAVLS